MGEVLSMYRQEAAWAVEATPIRDATELVDRAEIEAQARSLIDARDALPTVEVLPQERHDNARTAIMEALTASGHLSRIEISGALEVINQQILARLLNGYHVPLPEQEKKRRFYEICNELVTQRLHRDIVAGSMPPTTAVLEMSDFITGLSDKAAGDLGYRPLNKKGMVRSTHLRLNPDGSYTRIIEQISRSNGTAATTFAMLHGAEIYPDGSETPDVLALKTATLYDTEDLVDGAIDVQRRLDVLAGADVMYGAVPDENTASYEELRAESARREDQIEDFVDTLAAFDERLEQLETQNLISQEERQAQYVAQVRNILRAICTLAPEYAADCFGTEAAAYYQRAAHYEAKGDRSQALLEIENAKQHEQDVFICGFVISAELAEKLGIGVDSVGSLMEGGKESWKWKLGICQVKSCSTRPGRTEVGPCSVCRNCQNVFDHGGDPTKSKFGILTPAEAGKPKETAAALLGIKEVSSEARNVITSRTPQKVQALGELAMVS